MGENKRNPTSKSQIATRWEKGQGPFLLSTQIHSFMGKNLPMLKWDKVTVSLHPQQATYPQLQVFSCLPLCIFAHLHVCILMSACLVHPSVFLILKTPLQFFSLLLSLIPSFYFYPFWAAAPKGRCPVGYRGEFPDVRTYVRTYVPPPEAPLRPQISPLKPKISPLKPKISPLRPKISPLRLKISPLRPKISSFSSKISSKLAPNQPSQAQNQPSQAQNQPSQAQNQSSQAQNQPFQLQN